MTILKCCCHVSNAAVILPSTFSTSLKQQFLYLQHILQFCDPFITSYSVMYKTLVKKPSAYELLHELPNDLKLKSQNFTEMYPSTQSPPPPTPHPRNPSPHTLKLHSLQRGISSPAALLYPVHPTILRQYPTLTPFLDLSRAKKCLYWKLKLKQDIFLKWCLNI